ncbi:MAG: NAD-dependent epimerase/dehydratase family protein [Patescibacteria group bacterium]
MAKKVIFDKKNVLVAGGAGFVGSHLCDELIKTNKVICIDNFISGSEKNIDHLLSSPDFVFINHNLTEPINLEELPELDNFKIKFQGIQEVYNLACPMSPNNFLDNRLAILDANSIVTKNLLDLAVANEAKFLHFSSSVVYGNYEKDRHDYKVKESELGLVDNLSPRSAYDEGKRFAETLVANYRDIFKLDTKIIRLFRTYGPRMTLDDGQMIPDFINAAISNRDLIVYGDEGFSSSFCYIDDVIDAVTRIMSSELAGPINIGSDVRINLSDLAYMIIKEAGATSKVVYEPSNVFISELLLPDIYLARNELSWMPVVTLENGLKKTLFSLRANSGLQSFNS